MSGGEVPKRIYNMIFKRPVSESSEDCAAFREYIRNEITGSRELLNYEEIPDKSNCTLKIRMRSYSYGKKGPNALRNDLYLAFPDAQIKELSRERS